MSYPYDLPSLSMSTTWQSGSYKPTDVVRVIRDNITPVNKNSMVNSVGQEVSLVQNYVNSKYLGRTDLPIQTGYIQEPISNSGSMYIYNSGTDHWGQDIPIKDEIRIASDRVMIQHLDQAPVAGSGMLNMTGLYVYAFNGQTQAQTREMCIYPDIVRVYGSGPTAFTAEHGMGTWEMLIYPYSGISFRNTEVSEGGVRDLDINTSGISWGHSDSTTEYRNIKLSANPSGQFINIPNGQFVIGSGLPYSGVDYTQGGKNFGLTVGDDYGSGNVFFKTHTGGGIAFFGLNNIYDYVKSYASDAFGFYLEDGPSISLDKTNDRVYIGGIGGRGNLMVGNLGCNGVDPTGLANYIATPNSLNTLLTWATGVADLLKNFGFMAKS